MGAFDDLPDAKKSVFDDLPSRSEGPSSGGVLSNPVLNPALRFAIGAGRGLAGTGQFVTNLATQGTFPESQAFINRNVWDPLFRSFGRTGQILNPEGNMDIAGFGGEVLSPANLKLAKAMGPASSIWQRIAQGSVFGASSAATQPVEPGKDYPSEKRDQIAIGAATGATIPIAVEAVKFVGRPVAELIKYFAPGGTERLTTKWFNKIVGPDNIKEIVSDLESQLQSKVPTNVPGYKPTTGELISHIPESSPLLAVQNRVSGLPGGPSGQFARRAAENRAAIEGALAPIAGTEADLASAISARKTASSENYQAAFDEVVKRDKELREIWKNPFFKKEVSDAWELFRANNPTGKLKDNLTEFLQYVKVGLDDKLSKSTTPGSTALNDSQRRAIYTVRNNLVDWIEGRNDAFANARATHAEMSIPINRMQVGQALQDRLLSPTGTMTPGSYLRAINDETRLVKNATGQPRSSLGQVFNPAEQATIGEVGNLLERQLAVKNPPVKTNLGPGAIEDIAKISLPSLLSRPIVFANYILRSLTGGTSSLEKGVERVAAMRMLYPDQFIEAMNSMPKGKAAEVMAILERNGVTNQGTMAINPAVRGLLDNRD